MAPAILAHLSSVALVIGWGVLGIIIITLVWCLVAMLVLSTEAVVRNLRRKQ